MNAEIVSNSEGGGNTNSPPPSPPKALQTNARKHWFFTFNNYDSEDIIILSKVFDEICFMYAFQEETGAEGTPHLQGVISLKKRARWTEFGLPKAIHWEKPRNVTDCYLYCTKQETRTGHVFVKNYELPYTFKLQPEQLWHWQHDILHILSKKPNDRTVHWYWSHEGGVGKSTFVKHLVCNHKALLLTKGGYKDICNLVYKAKMTTTNLVVFDLPRGNGNKISYDAIESIKNGMITNMKYETGFTVFPSPHVIVFANARPDVYCLSNDRWNIVEIPYVY